MNRAVCEPLAAGSWPATSTSVGGEEDHGFPGAGRGVSALFGQDGAASGTTVLKPPLSGGADRLGRRHFHINGVKHQRHPIPPRRPRNQQLTGPGATTERAASI